MEFSSHQHTFKNTAMKETTPRNTGKHSSIASPPVELYCTQYTVLHFQGRV